MANFLPAGHNVVSADGLTVTLYDDSNYGTDTEGITIGNIGQRQAVVLDGAGNPVATVIFPPTQLSVSYAVTKDYYLATTLNFTKPDATIVQGFVNYLSTRIYDGKQLALASSSNCGCGCTGLLCDYMVQADLCKAQARTAQLLGFGSSAQTLIDAANALLPAGGGSPCL